MSSRVAATGGLRPSQGENLPATLEIQTKSGAIALDRTRLMRVVNVTPDSFSDGGRFFSTEAAVARAMEMEQAGAHIIDIGGQSTRPGSARVSPAEEIRRVVPVIEQLAHRLAVPISIDTYHSQVARAAMDAGAAIINDVSGLQADPSIARVAAATGAPLIIMHSLWPPETMQDSPSYVDVVEDVMEFLQEKARMAMALGVPSRNIIVDPGLGFGKLLGHNLELLRGLPQLLSLEYPLLVGPSRKRFLGELTGKGVEQRLWATAGAVALCAAMGAHIVRVHDVAEMNDVVRIVDAIVWQV